MATQFLKLRSSRRERQVASRRFFPTERVASALPLTSQFEKLSCRGQRHTPPIFTDNELA